MAPGPHELVVLLGPDYVGKSSVMRGLQRHSRFSLVSCDDEFVPEYISDARGRAWPRNKRRRSLRIP